MALESVLSVGMVEPATTVASTPSLAALEEAVPDERGGEDGGTISRRGQSPLDSIPEWPKPLKDPRRWDGAAPQGLNHWTHEAMPRRRKMALQHVGPIL
jgi:hypothetical protein